MAKLAKTVPPSPPEAGKQPQPRLKQRRGGPQALPDFSHLVTEDGAPVDSEFSELEMRLLASSLMSSWPYPDRQKLVCANVGLFSDSEPVVVPDVMLSLDVRRRPLGEKGKRGDSYFIQLYGKAPDVAIEIVSNKVGGEEEKLRRYARLGVRYAIIHDPWNLLSTHDLRAFTLRTDGTARESRSRSLFWMPRVGLGVTLWHGQFEGEVNTWLRWCDRQGNVLQTGDERAADNRADAERYLRNLRELGVDPD